MILPILLILNYNEKIVLSIYFLIKKEYRLVFVKINIIFCINKYITKNKKL